jgi:hypothetical protein
MFEGIFILIILFSFLGFFFWAMNKIRNGGGSMFSVVSGATDAFLDKEKKHAVEMIVEKNAGKKMDEQSNEDPPEKGTS